MLTVFFAIMRKNLKERLKKERDYYNHEYYPTWTDPHEPFDDIKAMVDIYGRIDWIASTAYVRGCKRLLDVGCGQGHLSIPIALTHPHTFQVTGIDISSRIIRVARKHARRYTAPVTFVTSALETYTPPYLYDAVICSHTLEHIHDLDTFMEALHRCVRHNGYIFLAVPTHGERHMGHLHDFTSDDIERLVKKHHGSYLQFNTMYEYQNDLCLVYVVEK